MAKEKFMGNKNKYEPLLESDDILFLSLIAAAFVACLITYFTL